MMNNQTSTGTSSPLKIPRIIATRILQHALHDPDQEVCGLIAARDGEPSRCFPVANIATDSERRYQMDPQTQIDALREIRESGEQLFAIYHSHPTSAAAPSLTDVVEAAYPDVLYLIVSLNTKGVLEMRGFRIRDGATIEEALEL